MTDTWVAPANYWSFSKSILLVTDSVPNVGQDGCTAVFAYPDTCARGCVDVGAYRSFVADIDDASVSIAVNTFVLTVPGADDPEGVPYDPLYWLSELVVTGGTAPLGCTSAPGTVTGCGNTTCLTSPGNYCFFDLAQLDQLANYLALALELNEAVRSGNPCLSLSLSSLESASNPLTIQQLFVEFEPYMSAQPPQVLQPASSSACTDGDYYVDVYEPGALNLCPATCDVTQNQGGTLTIARECKGPG